MAPPKGKGKGVGGNSHDRAVARASSNPASTNSEKYPIKEVAESVPLSAKQRLWRGGLYLMPFVYSAAILVWGRYVAAWMVTGGGIVVVALFGIAAILHFRDLSGLEAVRPYVQKHIFLSISTIGLLCSFAVGLTCYLIMRPTNKSAGDPVPHPQQQQGQQENRQDITPQQKSLQKENNQPKSTKRSVQPPSPRTLIAKELIVYKGEGITPKAAESKLVDLILQYQAANPSESKMHIDDAEIKWIDERLRDERAEFGVDRRPDPNGPCPRGTIDIGTFESDGTTVGVSVPNNLGPCFKATQIKTTGGQKGFEVRDK